MRVISGQARGLKLKAPEGLETRPTTDRIKESLFNIITGDIYEADFLDLFSGSGGIGIEALSRGAKAAVFVDESRKSLDAIRYNLSRTPFLSKAEVIKGNAVSVIRSLGMQGRQFDIIFMDPPYSMGLVEASLAAIQGCGILKEDGFIIAEQAVSEPVPDIAELEVYRIKDYKRTTKMTFLKRSAGAVSEDTEDIQ